MDSKGWGGVGWGVCIYNPVREKEHCGLRVAVLMLGFMPKATVAKRTSQRACRLGLHTVAPPPSQPLEHRASLPEATGLGLRNQTCTLSPGLGLGLAWAGQDCTTATRRLAAARTARSRGAWATWRMCHNDDNSALRGPSMLWHGSETRLGVRTNSDRARQ